MSMDSYIGNPPITETAGTRREWTPTDGQTTFTIQYAVGYLDVFVNGAKLASADFTATNGSSFTLNAAVTDQDLVAAIAWAKGDMVPTDDYYDKAEVDTLLSAVPKLVAQVDLTGRDMLNNPVVWALEDGHDYRVTISNHRSGVDDQEVSLQLGHAGGFFTGGTDYRWSGVSGATGSNGLAVGNATSGDSRFYLLNSLAGSVPVTSLVLDLFSHTLDSQSTQAQWVCKRHVTSASIKHEVRTMQGYLAPVSPATLTQAKLYSPDATAMTTGRVQVYRMPKL